MLIGNKCHLNKFDLKFQLNIVNNSILPVTHDKNLGVYIDSHLNFKQHVKYTEKMCDYFIREIYCIRCLRQHLTFDASTALANAPVSSRLDYCDSLLHYIAVVYLSKLQSVQNSLPRVVTKCSRFTRHKGC